MTDEYVCGYILRFEDRIEGRELQRGSVEDCNYVADHLHAIAVSTSERAKASMHVMPAETWDEIWKGGESNPIPCN